MASAVEIEYQQLIDHLNHQMLVQSANRVPILQRVLDALGNPDQSFRIIHIAGTNGKGSTGAMLAKILQKQGYRTGRFSSPAILSEREQIQAQGQMISAQNFLKSYRVILSVLPKLNLQVNDISIFEWFFLVSLVFFQHQALEWVILEAGLGGQFDATNAIKSPQITIFTSIAKDHQAILGNTIRAIALQKVKIVKPGTVVVSAPNQPLEALTVIKNECQLQKVHFFNSHEIDIKVESQSINGSHVLVAQNNVQRCKLFVSLAGDFQLINLQTVLETLWVLQQQGIAIEQKSIQQGLSQVAVLGRLSVLQQEPLMIADGAHNPAGMSALVNSLQRILPDTQYVWIVGVLKDKQYQEMLEVVLPSASMIITVTPDNAERAVTATNLAGTIQKIMPAMSVKPAKTMLAALNLANIVAATKPVIVSGSFYVLRELAKIDKLKGVLS